MGISMKYLLEIINGFHQFGAAKESTRLYYCMNTVTWGVFKVHAVSLELVLHLLTILLT